MNLVATVRRVSGEKACELIDVKRRRYDEGITARTTLSKSRRAFMLYTPVIVIEDRVPFGILGFPFFSIAFMLPPLASSTNHTLPIL